MKIYQLKFIKKHLFITVDGSDWLVDTGSPITLGDVDTVELMGRSFIVGNGAMGLDAKTVSGYVGVDIVGLIGVNVLNEFNVVFDITNEELTLSDEDINLAGNALELDECMGIPIVTASILGKDMRMFFDTGAQISYLQDDCITSFEDAGVVKDFYHGVGEFDTQTYMVNSQLGADTFVLKCGSLPETLGMTLMMANTNGIVGNEIMLDRVIGYFPKQHKLVLV